MLVVIGGALLLAAVVLAPLAVRAVRRWALRRALADLRPSAMASLAGRLVSVRGIATPGPDGILHSRLARIDCVWHGHEVLRHYWPLPGAPGECDRDRAHDSIAEYGSEQSFGIAGPRAPAGRGPAVLLDADATEITGAHMCLQRIVGRPQQGVPAPADELLPRVKGRISGIFRGETIEFEYREWVIRPGDPIIAHGRLELRDGIPTLTAPPDGGVRVERDSTAPGDEPVRPGADALMLGGGALMSACMGLLLVLAGA